MSFTLPGSGSCAFQNMYVSIVLRPPSLARSISFGHICIATAQFQGPTNQPTSNSTFRLHFVRFIGWKVTRVGAYLRRAPRVVDGAGEEEVPLAVDHERAPIVGDDAAFLREAPLRRRPSREQERERGGGHQHGRGPDGHVSRNCGNDRGRVDRR
jgi:hypothetical protein